MEIQMSRTAEMTIDAFGDALAAQTSTPGGGGAAAITGSMAASLVSMVIQFTLGKKKYAEVEEEFRGLLQQSEALRKELLALADADVEAFQGVSATYSMPKETDDEKQARSDAMQSALKHAAEIPYVTAEKCLQVINLAEPVGARGNTNVVSDAATAIYLAEAALKSAIANVNVNLKLIKDETFVATWAARRDAILSEARESVAAAISACQITLGIEL
jgi:methenyltetrahydrofolate cyclohydrolase